MLLNFDVANLLPGVSPIATDDAAIFVNELIRSDALLNFLRENKQTYDWVIFLPYLYGPIIHGISIVGGRAILQPCLHDEPYAYLPQIAQAFYDAQRLFFNSDGERELALKLFGPGIAPKSVVVGEGIELDSAKGNDPSRDSAAHGSVGRYVFYLGRKDQGKNVPLLIRAFQRFRLVRPNSDLQLVLAGNGSIELMGCDCTTDQGLVTEAQKSELLRNCVALMQPSANESFSRVIMEAWLYGKPVAVHSQCLATSVAVRESNGGWTANDEDDWARLFVKIDRAGPAELHELGENGRRYATRVADWRRVIQRYEKVFSESAKPARATRVSKESIHQVLPNLAFGDAISNQALFIRDFLRREGIESNVYVRYVDPRIAHECEVFSSGCILPRDSVIYHHSVGTELTPHLIAHQGPKFLIYHNITPAEFFEPYRPEFAHVLRQGRRELHKLAGHFPNSAGDSTYNADELRECGFCDPTVLPICVDPAKWNCPPDPIVMERLQDGRTNILFVGRIAPNKKQEELVRAFSYYLALDPTARLILLGTSDPDDPYVAHVHDTIHLLGLADFVLRPGSATEAQLAAYYRTSHLYWSMSEHEGFGVPLVEAMWFDVPVLAFRSSAIPETLGEAGLMLNDKSNLAQAAALARIIVSDSAIRAHIIRRQRERRVRFLPYEIAPLLAQLATGLKTPKPLERRRPAMSFS